MGSTVFLRLLPKLGKAGQPHQAEMITSGQLQLFHLVNAHEQAACRAKLNLSAVPIQPGSSEIHTQVQVVYAIQSS